MPRKGVPGIDGCLCEIKEKLKALYDRTHACILRINGKTPDGNGDITLDLSDAIPGRYVESVNGEDGNVIIDKASVGLSNVDNISSSQILNQADANNQSRLEAFEAAKLDPVELEVTANSGRIIQLEGQQVVLDDKMEQTIQYVDAIGDDVAEIKDTYVDKTTTQYITGKKFIPTPAAGEYSGIAVNKAYVELTDGTTNNLVHTIGNETITGNKNFTKAIVTKKVYDVWNGNLDGNKYRPIGYIGLSNNDNVILEVIVTGNGGSIGYGKILIGSPSTSSSYCRWIIRKGNFLTEDCIAIAKLSDISRVYVLCKNSAYTSVVINELMSKNGGDISTERFVAEYQSTDYKLDGTDPDVEFYIKGSDF